jgi:hypothetical protein
VSPTWQSRPTSPRASSAVGHHRPLSPVMGNLARLASRRRSNAVGYRRTSNFLELPGKLFLIIDCLFTSMMVQFPSLCLMSSTTLISLFSNTFQYS